MTKRVTEEKRRILARRHFVANEIGRLLQEQRELQIRLDGIDMQERLHSPQRKGKIDA